LPHGFARAGRRVLEKEPGSMLFVRNGRHVKVTADGLRFARVLGRSVAEIAMAAGALRPGQAAGQAGGAPEGRHPLSGCECLLSRRRAAGLANRAEVGLPAERWPRQAGCITH
jgi:hypothetical protein